MTTDSITATLDLREVETSQQHHLFLRAFLALWRKIVVDSDFRAGCPVLAVSIEEPPTDETPPPW